MKNEQSQTKKQDQPLKHPPQQNNTDASANGNAQKNITGNQQRGTDKSNISVDNEGKIGKAHDRWPGDDDKKENQDIQKDERRTRSDKTVTEPEIDAPIYDPEKTEKKIPKM